MKVLVTGGSGWIGRATCRALEEQGDEPVPYDRSDGQDILDFETLVSAVPRGGHVIHLAGVLGTHELFETPFQAVEVNVMGTMNVLQACLMQGAGYTGIVMPKVNPSLYSATKNCGKDFAEAYRIAQGLPVSHVIAYNAFGPGQAYGHGHPQKILPTFAVHAWNQMPLPIWGDGELWTDLVHVDDVGRMMAEAIVFHNGQVFDAGTGVPMTVNEAAQSVLQFTKSDAGVWHNDPRPGERAKRTDEDYASGRGWDLLGWKPERDEQRWVEAIESYRGVAL